MPTEFELSVCALAPVAQNVAAQNTAVPSAAFFVELTNIEGADLLLDLDINVEPIEEQNEFILPRLRKFIRLVFIIKLHK